MIELVVVAGAAMLAPLIAGRPQKRSNSQALVWLAREEARAERLRIERLQHRSERQIAELLDVTLRDFDRATASARGSHVAH